MRVSSTYTHEAAGLLNMAGRLSMGSSFACLAVAKPRGDSWESPGQVLSAIAAAAAGDERDA
jgi:hypothetical protein